MREKEQPVPTFRHCNSFGRNCLKHMVLIKYMYQSRTRNLWKPLWGKEPDHQLLQRRLLYDAKAWRQGAPVIRAFPALSSSERTDNTTWGTCPRRTFKKWNSGVGEMTQYWPGRGPEFGSWHPYPVPHNHLSLQLRGIQKPLASMGNTLHTSLPTYTHNKSEIRDGTQSHVVPALGRQM